MKHPQNFLFGYLTRYLNSFWEKKYLILGKLFLMHHVQFEYFVISGTKLDHSFPLAQFKLADYEIRARKDGDGNRDRIMKYV